MVNVDSMPASIPGGRGVSEGEKSFGEEPTELDGTTWFRVGGTLDAVVSCVSLAVH